MKRQPLLEIEKLVAGYGELEVLHDVDLSLAEGELGVIIGPNGSGKSTVIKALFGLNDRFSGSVRFAGEELTGLATHEVVKRGVAYVPQGRLVFDALSVEENLAMGGYTVARGKLSERRERVYKLFPILQEKAQQQASFLSGGQQQMLSIGRALMQAPRLLLLDEPSLGLDPKTQQLIFKTVKEINETGVTVLMVEQNARQALRVCDRAWVIEQGRVAARGGKGLARRKEIRELYLGG